MRKLLEAIGQSILLSAAILKLPKNVDLELRWRGDNIWDVCVGHIVLSERTHPLHQVISETIQEYVDKYGKNR